MRNGEPTEAAIRVLVEKLGCPDEGLNKRCLQKEKRSKDDAMAFSNYWMKGKLFFVIAVAAFLVFLLAFLSCWLRFRYGEKSRAGVQPRPQVYECLVA